MIKPLIASSFTSAFCRGSTFVQIKIRVPFSVTSFDFLAIILRPQQTYIFAECAVLCIKHVINVTIDSHQEMFYRAADLEMSSHQNISSGAFYQIWRSLQRNPFKGVYLQGLFLFYVYRMMHRQMKKVKKADERDSGHS